MKLFWKVLGIKNNYYTGKAVSFVVDKKTGRRYEIGEAKWYKTKDYPKNLLEKVLLNNSDECRYEFHYALPFSSKEKDYIEKTGFFGKKRRVSSPFCAETFEREFSDLAAFWAIEGLNAYTAKAADIIRDKETGKEYHRGKIEFFSNEEIPFPLTEHTDKYEFIYELSSNVSTDGDLLREVSTSLLLHSLFKGK